MAEISIIAQNRQNAIDFIDSEIVRLNRQVTYYHELFRQDDNIDSFVANVDKAKNELRFNHRVKGVLSDCDSLAMLIPNLITVPAFFNNVPSIRNQTTTLLTNLTIMLTKGL